MKYVQGDRVVLLVEKQNLTWPPGTVIEDYEGNQIQVPEVFPKGTVGYVLVPLNDTCTIDVFLNGVDMDEHLGVVSAGHSEIEPAEHTAEEARQAWISQHSTGGA